jgi:hypothetical protein
MPLSSAHPASAPGIDKDRPDFTVYCGAWNVGRIYQTRGGPENLRWFWSMSINGPMTRSDRVVTLDEAKAQFQKSLDEARFRGNDDIPAPMYLDKKAARAEISSIMRWDGNGAKAVGP